MEEKNAKNTSVVLYKHHRVMLDKIIASGYSNSISQLIRAILDQYMRDYLKVVRSFDVLTKEQIKIIGE